jgi:hypothetical protein
MVLLICHSVTQEGDAGWKKTRVATELHTGPADTTLDPDLDHAPALVHPAATVTIGDRDRDP